MDHLIAALREAFGWLECRSLRVGLVVLHPEQVGVLADYIHFDKTRHPELETMHGFGKYVGCLWGAHVVEHTEVVPGHIGIFPDGATVTAVDGTACFSLGLQK